jgi:hypothetical protein
MLPMCGGRRWPVLAARALELAAAQLDLGWWELEQRRARALELEAAATRWARAYVEAGDATGRQLTLAALEYHTATHDLILAAGEPCPLCEPGTCPGAIGGRLATPVADTPPL